MLDNFIPICLQYNAQYLPLQCWNINSTVTSTFSNMDLRSVADVLWSFDTRSIDFSHIFNNSWQTNSSRFVSRSVSSFLFIISPICFNVLNDSKMKKMKTWWLVNSYVIIFSTSLPWIEDHGREEKFRWKFSHLINYPSRRTKIVPVSVAIIPRRISEQGSPKHRDHWLRKNNMEINYIYIFNIQIFKKWKLEL